jgi:hypothetical protein
VRDRSPLRRALDAIIDPPRAAALRYGIRKIVGEDNRICEGLQRAAHKVTGSPRLAAQEERIAWFDEAYARITAAEPRVVAGNEYRRMPQSAI